MLHCLLIIRIIYRKQHNNRALFVNVSKRLQQPAPRPDFLTPIPFAVWRKHMLCVVAISIMVKVFSAIRCRPEETKA